MNNVLLHPTYFPNISHFVGMVKADKVVFERHDNFEKQTYRTRTYIYGANGKLLLNIPVEYTQKKRQLYRDVRISNTTDWQSLHWKSMQSAYLSSPFFEFYEDDLRPLFETKTDFIYDFNIACFQTICECLQLEIEPSFTKVFDKSPQEQLDLRGMVNSKKEIAQSFDRYIQVFDDKHGFIPNLSILDLLFSEGPNSLNYLESQELNI
ncbi:WbqC family protein [Mangrovimonas aestuarii]|uniref:WbqC family protein n=1 Tax=Mangrovimonas aestuarii TaxID=3018443 RepID=UPI0023781DAD|nr:WbqC family protein [Mangrovimonas aestuarii]